VFSPVGYASGSFGRPWVGPESPSPLPSFRGDSGTPQGVTRGVGGVPCFIFWLVLVRCGRRRAPEARLLSLPP